MSFSRDTSPEARQVVFDALRRATPGERFQMAVEHSEFVRQLVLESVRRDFPESSADERHARFLERWLGEDLGRRVAEWRSERRGTGSS